MASSRHWRLSDFADEPAEFGPNPHGVVRQFVISAIEPPNYPISDKELDAFRLTTKEKLGIGPILLLVTPIACEMIGFATLEHLDPTRAIGIPTLPDAIRMATELRKRGTVCRVLVLRGGK